MNLFMTAKIDAGGVAGGVTGGETDEVVGHAVRSTEQSVEEVFKRHWKPLLNLATVLVGNPQIGEEIAQEAFTKWYVHRSSVDHPYAYLRTIVVNLRRGHHRRTRVSSSKAHYLQTEADLLGASTHDVMLDMVDHLPSRGSQDRHH
jgi:DNA-directed RNA polymerase specialized sigma24 family protein